MIQPETPLARARRWLQAWDGHGVHRTGTAGDEAGAAWLAGEVERLGIAATSEEWEFDRLDPIACFLEIGSMKIDGVPVFDAPATGADGVVGRLGPMGSTAAIGVAEMPPQAVYSGAFETLRREAPHRALVVVCRGARSGLGLLNAERFSQPYGAPAIHVSSDAGEAVLTAAERGANARLVAASRRVRATAHNIVARLPGHDRGRPTIVVMTPRSSWWQSTAERGGGIVCWLETLRALSAEPSGGPAVFTANSGHELGHLGLDDFLARRPGWQQPPAAGGALWVHYGANLGAAGGELSVVSADPALARVAADELRRAGEAPSRVMPSDFVPSGETRDIHRAGGRYLTLVGTNPWFHLPDDRWPYAVAPDAIERIAAAGAAIVVRLSR